MSTTLVNVYAWLSIGLAVVLSYVILSNRVHEGVVIKVGLIFMVAGLLASAGLTLNGQDTAVGQFHASLCIRIGLGIVIFGYLRRQRRAGHPCLRAADWRAPRGPMGMEPARAAGRGFAE